jgi:hypothetical protein
MKLIHLTFRSLAAVCLAFMLSSASCSLLDKLDDVNFDVDLEHTFIINASTTDPLSYADVNEFDPTDNADFNKYKSKVKEVTIKSVEYTVTNYVGDPSITFSNGKGSFFTVGTSSTALASAGIDIQNISAVQGVTKTLDYTVQGLEAIGNEIEQLRAVKFEVSGNVSQVPVAFNVLVKIRMTIKADAL